MPARTLCLIAGFGLFLSGQVASAAATASTTALEDCTSRFDTLAAADQLHGISWDQFRTMVCGLGSAPAATAAPAPSTATATPPPKSGATAPTVTIKKAGQPSPTGCRSSGRGKRGGSLLVGKTGTCTGGRKGG